MRTDDRGRTVLVTILIVTALFLSLVSVVSQISVKAEGTVVWTDKAEYTPGENVTVYGSGFRTDASVAVSVTRPDNHVDEWSVSWDGSGNFITTYQLDGIEGTYTVTATDGTNTATTTFTDAAIVTYSDSACTDSEIDFLQGATVYAKATGLRSDKYHKIEWFDPSSVSVKATVYGTGATSRIDSYTLSSDAPVGHGQLKSSKEPALPVHGLLKALPRSMFGIKSFRLRLLTLGLKRASQLVITVLKIRCIPRLMLIKTA